MTTAPTPPKPTEEHEDPPPVTPGEDSTKKKAKASWFTFRRTMVVGGVLSAAWGAVVLAGRKWGGWTAEQSGTFGDSFAPLLGLLTVAALAAALDSVRMQREELQLQRRELELTREEMKAQRLATESQAAEVKRANELAVKQNQLASDANDLAYQHGAIAVQAEKTATEANRIARMAHLVDAYRLLGDLNDALLTSQGEARFEHLRPSVEARRDRIAWLVDQLEHELAAPNR